MERFEARTDGGISKLLKIRLTEQEERKKKRRRRRRKRKRNNFKFYNTIVVIP